MRACGIFLILLFLDFYCQPIKSQIRNNRFRRKNAIDLADGSGHEETNGTSEMKIGMLTSDDEDAVRLGNSNIVQSSGDGLPEPPEKYPVLNPYTKTRSTATVLVEFAIEEEYKSYMLPGATAKYKLKQFHNEIIKNLKAELKNLNLDLGFEIVSLRPGPLFPRKYSRKSHEDGNPSVFARVNITQYNSSIVNPLIIFHISQCGRLGILGNLTISDQIIFPQNVCQNDEVYCLPKCERGAYCDGIQDCPNTNLDESPSCPKCLYKHLKLSANNEFLNEGENLILQCDFKDNCRHLENKIRWKFPPEMKAYENSFKGQRSINTLQKEAITSGSYKCLLDGDVVVKNITVFKKPQVFITHMNPDAEVILISELEGSDIDLWCNTTNGHSQWTQIDPSVGTVTQLDKSHSKISLKPLGTTTNLQCQIRWGYEERSQILKTVTLNVVCDPNKQFRCTGQTGIMCLPINQKCDSIAQCEDGSDEQDCHFCADKSISVDTGPNILKDVGDAVIMSCSSTQESCNPLKWYRNNKPLTSTENLFVFKSSVFIMNISTSYAGIYKCSGPNDKGHYDVSIQINEAPILKLNPPVTTLNLTYGQSQDIECSVTEPKNSSDHNLTPVWNLSENKILQDNSQVKYETSKRAIISLNRVTKAMEGKYQCEVMWGVTASKKVSQIVFVNVIPLACNFNERMCADKTLCVPASMWCDGLKQCHDGSDEKTCTKCQNGFVLVQPTNVVVLSGQSAQVTCYYHRDCYPVEWRMTKNRSPLDGIEGISARDNKLIFKNARPSMTNSYECFSGDKVSQTNVTVINEVVLTFTDNRPYMFVDFGSDIDINCVSNYGEPKWVKRDFPSLNDVVGAKQMLIQPTVSRLTIKSASYDARGYYNCSVKLPGSKEIAAEKRIYIHVYDLECDESYIKCDKNTKCIPKHKQCDSIQDCNDNEDEKNCSKCKFDLDIKPKSLVLSTGGWDNFECIVPNEECRPIKWISRSGTNIKINGFVQFKDKLFIFNASPMENEEIICTNGVKSASTYLTVKHLDLFIFPNPVNDSVIYINRGDTKSIECRSSIGTPQWVFPREDAVSNFGIKYLQSQSDVAIIIAENIQDNANGVYTCSVTFSRETKKKSISIKVI